MMDDNKEKERVEKEADKLSHTEALAYVRGYQEGVQWAREVFRQEFSRELKMDEATGLYH